MITNHLCKPLLTTVYTSVVNNRIKCFITPHNMLKLRLVGVGC